MDNFHHISVLREELVSSLQLQPGDYAIDCTAGGGGHTELLLDQVGPKGRVLAIDRDPIAQAVLHKRFSGALAEQRLVLIQAGFSSLSDLVSKLEWQGKVQGICADIGVSSPQLDESSRGFSFSKNGPLDMRMDQSAGRTAAELVNEGSEEELTQIFREFGEDPKARIFARAIVKRRASKIFEETADLAEFIASQSHYRERSRKHPATKIFQALRIEVNQELTELKDLLSSAPSILRVGGRFSVISFHSLEDRLIKRSFKHLVDGERPKFARDYPITQAELDAMYQSPFRIIKPFPQEPSEEELSLNPRARSAKLRVVERER